MQVLLLVDGLAARGWRNAIACRGGSAVEKAARRRDIETHCTGMRNDFDLASVIALRAAIRSSGAGLVHLHTGRATWLGGLAARLARVPAISTRRMDRPVPRGWRTRLVYERLVRHVVAISPAVADRLVVGGAPASKISVIASAVDSEALRPRRVRDDVRRELGTPAEQPAILALARLVPRKGIDVLVNALAILARDGLAAELWIAGDGPEEGALKALVSKLGLDGIRFLGRRTDVADLLGACDVVAVPSRLEGLGVAALEAMAAGRPVVASAVGGLAEAVVHGCTGLLVPPDDPAALANALDQLIRDPALREALGGAGPQRVAEGFSAEQMVDSYVRLYEKVLEEWRRRAHRA